MIFEQGDLIARCRREKEEALRQIEFFGSGGVEALLLTTRPCRRDYIISCRQACESIGP